MFFFTLEIFLRYNIFGDYFMEEKIKELIDEIRPFLAGDGGDIEFIRYEDHYVYIKLSGACKNCLYQDGTISYGIEALLKSKIPEIEGVINVDL